MTAAPTDRGQPYGPQTTAIRRFLQHLAAIPAREWTAIAGEFAVHAATRPFARADLALGQLIERAGREAERDAALGPLLQLVRLPDDAPSGGSPADDPSADGDAELPLAPVAEAALAAVLALLVRDLLPASTFDTLYAPFAARIPLARLDA